MGSNFVFVSGGMINWLSRFGVNFGCDGIDSMYELFLVFGNLLRGK